MAFPVGLALQFAGPLLGGLLGGNRMSPEQERAYKLQQAAANQMYRYSQSVPGSDPAEAAALAQNQALLGERQLQQSRQLQGQLQLGQQGSGSLQDFLSNQSSLQTAQRMSISQEHLMNALAQRKQSLLQAAGLAGQAYQTAQQRQQNSLAPMLGQLGETLSYQQAMKKYQQQNRPVGSGPGETPAAGIASAPLGPPDITRPSPGISEWASRYQQGLGAMVAPGNEPGGVNTQANQMRQPLGGPLVPLSEKIRQYVGANGLRFG